MKEQMKIMARKMREAKKWRDAGFAEAASRLDAQVLRMLMTQVVG